MLKAVKEKEESLQNLVRLEEGLVAEQRKTAEVDSILEAIEGAEGG